MRNGCFDNSYYLRRILQKWGNPKLCLESALYQHGYTTYRDMYPTILSDYLEFKTPTIEYIKDRFHKDMVTLESGIEVTSLERTICEMIYYDRDPDLILQALDDYVYMYKKDVVFLRQKAIEYGVKETLDELLEEVKDF